MKNSNFKSFGSKAAKTLIAVAILSAAGFTACKKDATTTPSTTVTEADAVELTTDAVVPSTGGMVNQTTDAVIYYNTYSLSCGEGKDSTVNYTSPAGITPSFSYGLKWNWVLNCNGAVPSQVVFNISGNHTYNGALMSSSDASTASFLLSSLEPSSTNYVFNSSYMRSGSQTSKIGYQNTFTSNISIKSTNINVSKSTDEIVSGTGSISITGASTSGKSFTYGGTITFLGNKKATIVLNSGTSYPIQWN